MTADYGEFDRAHPQVEQDIEVDWIRIIDGVDGRVDSLCPLPPWRTWTDIRPATDPRLAAKRMKCTPWVVAPGYDRYIWIDASMSVTSPAFAREALEDLGSAPVAAFRHPRRSSIWDEMRASVGSESQGKYSRAALEDQCLEYETRFDYRDELGLFACGTIAWNANDPNARYVGARWLRECQHHSVQDQLSFPFACWYGGAEPAVFRHPQMGASGWDMANPWMTNYAHRR